MTHFSICLLYIWIPLPQSLLHSESGLVEGDWIVGVHNWFGVGKQV